MKLKWDRPIYFIGFCDGTDGSCSFRFRSRIFSRSD